MPYDNLGAERFSDIEAERAVLGTIMETEGWERLGKSLRPDCFTGPLRRFIFDTLSDLRKDGAALDRIVVLRKLLADPGVANSGISDEWQRCGWTIAADYYAEVVATLAALRSARAMAAEFLNARPCDSTGKNRALLSSFITNLTKIEDGKPSNILHISEILHRFLAQLEDEYQGVPGTEILSTGFEALDKAVGGFMPGIFHLYAGRPGEGKTSLLVGFLRALGRAGVPCGVFWLEDPDIMLALRMLAAEGELPSKLLRHGKGIEPSAWDRIQKTAGTVALWPIHVEPTRGLTSNDITQRMRVMARDKGVRVFFTDHLGKIKLQRGDRIDLELGYVAADYLDTAAELNACPVAFHQLSRKADEPGPAGMHWLFNSDVIAHHARVIGYVTKGEVGTPRAKTFTMELVKTTYGTGETLEFGWEGSTMRVFQPKPPK